MVVLPDQSNTDFEKSAHLPVVDENQPSTVIRFLKDVTTREVSFEINQDLPIGNPVLELTPPAGCQMDIKAVEISRAEGGTVVQFYDAERADIVMVISIAPPALEPAFISDFTKSHQYGNVHVQVMNTEIASSGKFGKVVVALPHPEFLVL